MRASTRRVQLLLVMLSSGTGLHLPATPRRAALRRATPQFGAAPPHDASLLRSRRAGALAAAAPLLPAPALALGTDGALDGAGIGITGVAWVDALFVLFLLGICGLIFTTTIEDFGQPSNRTFNTPEREWADAAPPALEEEREDEGPNFL